MHRRPSVASSVSFSPLSRVQSLQPLSILGSPNFVSLNGRLPPTRAVSLHTLVDTSEILTDSATDYEADELFTKHSVAEIKNIQRRLRTDADAKQEELRLMVGERYRDLLQASTSIISIAQSSEHVLDALDEMKQIISSQEIPQTPKGISPQSKNDSNLQTFQSLGAHMKLLLDAPEHLWRLIERKEYFRAAWLFLLARVVHHALIHDDADEDRNWQLQGISVSDQFPLVRRQWETVAQFRPQISHKATLSLREPSAASEQTCATLLTLYLLDSRPLSETLSIFLAQRSRTLTSLLSKAIDSPTAPAFRVNVTKPNGQPVRQNSLKEPRKLTFKEVQQSVESSLDIISRTVGTSRTIFEHQPGTDESLMTRVLAQIQADSDVATMKLLPFELQLSTQLLLTSLPSSTHFLQLPPSVKSYVPYVDLTSTSSSFSQPALSKKLKEWFEKAMQEFSHALEFWFTNLSNMKEAWRLRLWTREWIANVPSLQGHERDHITAVVDDVCRRQLASIWKASFALAKDGFTSELESAVRSGGDSANAKFASLPFLLRAPPLPLHSSLNMGPSQANASLRKYKSALRRQVTGRTPLLDQVLKPIESCAKSLQKDLKSLKTEGDDTHTLIAKLLQEYKPDAEILSSGVFDSLKSVVDKLVTDATCPVSTLVFVSSLAEELSSSSGFITNLGCDSVVIETFRDQMRAVHDLLIDRWRTDTVSRISHEYWKMCPAASAGTEESEVISPNYSSALNRSLLALSTALQELGIALQTPRRDTVAKQTLLRFLYALAEGHDTEMIKVGHRWNLLFLQKLLDKWDPDWLQNAEPLQSKMRDLALEFDAETQVSSYLTGTQTLLASLFPTVDREITSTGKVDKSVALLRHGLPSTPGKDTHPTVDVVKPSTRFGLLLVANTTTTR